MNDDHESEDLDSEDLDRISKNLSEEGSPQFPRFHTQSVVKANHIRK